MDHSKTLKVVDMQRFAALRAEHRRKKKERENNIDDDWLDDQELYCENAAKWGVSVIVPGGAKRNKEEKK